MPFNTDNTVAVIVPVYNMEKYIGRCIDSLKRQTHSHCLFLIVDDGSTDQSLFKIKEQTQNVVCRKDARVIDEIPKAYKSIDKVMANQTDLVKVLHTLTQLVCVKG